MIARPEWFPIDSSNQFGVVRGIPNMSPSHDYVTITEPITGAGGEGTLTRDQALNLAAWLVTIADPDGKRFTDFLFAIRKL